MCNGDGKNDFELANLWIDGCTVDELKTLRAKINGKIGKRKISPEAQAIML